MTKLKNVRISSNVMAWTLRVLYALTLVPMFMIGMYNYPSADDFSMTDTVYHAYKSGAGLLSLIWEAMKFGFHDYMTYTGYFTSAALTAFDPAVFGEQYYVVVFPITIITLTFATWYVFRCILTKALKVDPNWADVLSTLSLLAMVQCMPAGNARSEGFYWYSGTINYTFMFSASMIYVGLVISVIYDQRSRKQKYDLIMASILGFFAGGGNYLSSLSTALVSLIFIFYAFIWKKIPKRIVIPAVFMLIGFAISCAGPGNSVRREEVDGMGAIPAVFVCLLYTLHYCINQWTTWIVLSIFALMAVVAWKIAPQIQCKCQHPLIMFVMGYGFISANIMPPIYAESNIMAGRLVALFWMQYLIVVCFLIVYLVRYSYCYITGGAEKKQIGSELGNLSTRMVLALSLFILFGSALSVRGEHHFYTFTSAMVDLASGDAKQYRLECEERKQILNDPAVMNVELKSFSCRPELLFYSDIDPDESNWINKAVAYYYGKDRVVLIDNK